MEPTETPISPEEPSRALRAIAALRAAPLAKRRAYAAIGAAVVTAIFVGAAVAIDFFRGIDGGDVWAAGAAQLIGAFDGLVQSATLKSEL